MIIYITPHPIHNTSTPYHVATFNILLRIWLILEMHFEDIPEKVVDIKSCFSTFLWIILSAFGMSNSKVLLSWKVKGWRNISKTTWWTKDKPFQCYLQFFKVITNLGIDIYNMQAFNTTWVNSPAWCTIKIGLYLQQLLTSLSFQELFISSRYHRRGKLAG